MAPTRNEMLRIPDAYAVGKARRRDGFDACPVRRKPLPAFCPVCGAEGNVKDYTKRSLFHPPVCDKPTVIELSVRRHVCPTCRLTFIDEPLISEQSCHLTPMMLELVTEELMQFQSVQMISRHLGPSPSIVNGILDSMDIEYDYLPNTLCMDEFKADTDKGKMSVCAVDGDNGQLIDVLPHLDSAEIAEWIADKGHLMRKEVEFFCCDMSPLFLGIAKTQFPSATICVDHFHVSQSVTKAVQGVRRSNAEKIADGDVRAQVKRSWNLFVMRKDKLTEKQAARLEGFLSLDGELAETYRFLQLYFDVSALPWSVKVQDLYSQWMRLARESEIPELAKAGETLWRYRGYIFNAMRYNKSNAYAEGVNNSIKVLKRIAYGYHKFERLRTRALLCLGPVRVTSDHVRLPKASGR